MAAGGAASKADGRRLLYALVKIAYGGQDGTHGTVPAGGETSERTRVTRGHPHKGDSEARQGQRSCVISRPEGGMGIGGSSRDGASRPPPTAGSWLHSFLILTLRPRTLSHGRGMEKPKGTEQLELAARGRSSRSGCKARSCRSSRPRHPRGDCVVLEGGFYLRFLSSHGGLRSSASLHNHTHRRWGIIGSRGTAEDRGRRGADVRDLRCLPRQYEYGYMLSCAHNASI
jgi:hypothetical protein